MPDAVTPSGWVRHLWNRVLFPAAADPHTRVRLLSLLLVLVLPAVLSTVQSIGPRSRSEYPDEFILSIMTSCLAALYVSSVSTSGIRALVVSFTALPAAAILSAVLMPW